MIVIIFPLVKSLFMLIILLDLKNLNRVIKFANLKLLVKLGLLSIRIFLSKVILKNTQKKHSDIIDNIKIVLDLSNYATKNN